MFGKLLLSKEMEWCQKLLIRMFSKLWQYQIIWYLFAGFRIITLCSVHCVWFMKYLFSAKIFMKTSTRIMKFKSWVNKSNSHTCSTPWEDQGRFVCKWIWCIRQWEVELSRNFGNIYVVDCWQGDCGCKFWCDILVVRAYFSSKGRFRLFGLSADTNKVIFGVAIEADLSPSKTFRWLMVLTPIARTGFFWLQMLLFFVIWDCSNY